MKLVFTDIDGIFNSKTSRRKTRREGIIRDAVRLFDSFILGHDVQVVLTTEQRRYTTLPELLDILGTTQRERFIDVTPIGSDGAGKSREIEEWFLQHGFNVLGDEKSDGPTTVFKPASPIQPLAWAILDDRPLLYSLADILFRLVTVDAHIGLTEDALMKVLVILSPIDDTDPIL